MSTPIRIAACTILALTAFLTTSAKAAQLESVSVQFQSGASFSGIVTLSDDLSSVLGVDGQLSGYSYDAFTYVGGSATDHIDWVLNPGINYAVTPNTVETFLLDGTPGDYLGINNQLILTYDVSNAPQLVLSDADLGTAVNYTDVAIGGSISPVPLPTTWPLFATAIGLLGLAGTTRRTRNQIA